MHGASGEIATEISLSLSNNFIIDFLFFPFYSNFLLQHIYSFTRYEYADLC